MVYKLRRRIKNFIYMKRTDYKEFLYTKKREKILQHSMVSMHILFFLYNGNINYQQTLIKFH